MAEKLTEIQRRDRRRIIELSYKHNLSHIGSCLTAVDPIAAAYDLKRPDEKFVLSEGHAGLALYTIMERYGLGDAEEMLQRQGIHPDRLDDPRMAVSTGSLGQGLPIAVGMALADRQRRIFCLISDGEMSEGSIWEALRIAGEQRLANLKTLVNANGYGAYGKVNNFDLAARIRTFGWQIESCDGHNPEELRLRLGETIDNQPLACLALTNVQQLPFLKGIDAHYKVMNEDEYKLAMKEFK